MIDFPATSWVYLGMTAAGAGAANPSAVLAVVFLSLIVVYLASKVGGELCVRLNLPAVLGELTAGVIVGVSGLHLLVFPGQGQVSGLMQVVQAGNPMDPVALNASFEAASQVIATLGDLGVVILLFEIGLESNLRELLKVGYQSALVATVGVIAPFALGTGGLMLLFGTDMIPAILAGAAMTATSIGITAKVLEEFGQLTSREGQIIIGAAVLDDVMGIIVLAVVSGLIETGSVQLLPALGVVASAVAFFVGGVFLGRGLAPLWVKLLGWLRTRGDLLVTALIFALVLAYIAVTIKLGALLGAFVAGLVLAETDKREALEHQVKPLSDALVPIFFVLVGARTDVTVLNPFEEANRSSLTLAAFLFIVACVGKLVTGLAVVGQPKINRLAIGVGMIPRGEVGLVFAAYGAMSGALDKTLQAAIVVMVILTTFVAPPLLRLTFKGDLVRQDD
jgi:Kef-type K+ transport system membrane component KefB